MKLFSYSVFKSSKTSISSSVRLSPLEPAAAQRRKKQPLNSVSLFVLGLLILTLGISLTIHSRLGTSPFDALLVGLAQEVGLTVGSWEVVIAFVVIICNSLLTKQRPEVLGLLTAFITGIGIDAWLYGLKGFAAPEQMIGQLGWFLAGLIIIGLGTSLYLYAKFAPIPVDRLMVIIQERTGRNIFFARTFIYLLFLILALFFNGPIGIGTILTVCFGGLILSFFMPLTEKVIASTWFPFASTAQKRHP